MACGAEVIRATFLDADGVTTEEVASIACATVRVFLAELAHVGLFGGSGEGTFGRFTAKTGRAICVCCALCLVIWIQEACTVEVICVECSLADVTCLEGAKHRRVHDLA
tara:strand:+ start:885 stop:1211 length:327 start_codon:yes stop_codon:yes gene_type:complete